MNFFYKRRNGCDLNTQILKCLNKEKKIFYIFKKVPFYQISCIKVLRVWSLNDGLLRMLMSSLITEVFIIDLNNTRRDHVHVERLHEMLFAGQGLVSIFILYFFK
jgi:hypothetical protein